MPLSAPGPGRSSIANSIDQRPAGRTFDDLIRWKIQLQQTHRALDVDAHRSRINMRGRNQHTAHWRSVPTMRIGIKDQIRHPRSQAGVDRLLQTAFIERLADLDHEVLEFVEELYRPNLVTQKR